MYLYHHAYKEHNKLPKVYLLKFEWPNLMLPNNTLPLISWQKKKGKKEWHPPHSSNVQLWELQNIKSPFKHKIKQCDIICLYNVMLNQPSNGAAIASNL